MKSNFENVTFDILFTLTLFFAISNALVDISIERILASFLAEPIAIAMQPEPVPTSSTLGLDKVLRESIATSTNFSVSILGIKTSGETDISFP